MRSVMLPTLDPRAAQRAHCRWADGRARVRGRLTRASSVHQDARTRASWPLRHLSNAGKGAEPASWATNQMRAARLLSAGLLSYFATFFFALPFGGSRVFASSSDMPLVSGTTRNTNTNDSAAKKAYMP